MRIKLTRDVKLVDGSYLYQGAQFDVLEDEDGLRHGPYIDGKPGFVKVSLFGEELSFFWPEFEIVSGEPLSVDDCGGSLTIDD